MVGEAQPTHRARRRPASGGEVPLAGTTCRGRRIDTEESRHVGSCCSSTRTRRRRRTRRRSVPMRAVALTAPGQVRIVDDWPEPACGSDQVIVQIRGVGLCGSDLSVFDGKRQVPRMPWVFGHEGGGDIVAVGSAVTDRQVGQRVVIEPNYCDLTCVECRAGHSSACLNRVVLAINTPGILAERVAAPAEFTWPISTGWPDVALACFEPLCVADTAVRRADVPAGAECLVIGAGSQGQLVCQSLLAGGAVPYVTEPHPGRLELAVKFGARPAEE